MKFKTATTCSKQIILVNIMAVDVCGPMSKLDIGIPENYNQSVNILFICETKTDITDDDDVIATFVMKKKHSNYK